MEMLNLAIIALVSTGFTVASGLGLIFFIGRRNRKIREAAFAATVPAATGTETPPHPDPAAIYAACVESLRQPAQPPFDPTNILEAIRIVTEACTSNGLMIEQHERHLQHHQQALVTHDNALVEFQRKEAIAAHAIAMLQEGQRDLTALTSQNFPSGKMFPSVNAFLERKRPVPTIPVPNPDEEGLIIDDADYIPTDDEPAVPQIPPPYPPPARPETAGTPKPKRNRKKP